MKPISPGTAKYNLDESVKLYTTGDSAYGVQGGFPLFQPATGPAPGAPDSGNVPGVRQYKELSGVVDNPADTFWDPQAQAAYFYDGANFWTGEDARSIKAKVDYVHSHGLGGVMMFSLYDDPKHILFDQVVTDLGS